MNRAILIEDRPERQRIFLERKMVNLDEFSVLTNLNGGKEPERFKTEFLDFENIKNELSDYDVIMTHRSAWASETRMLLRDFCKREQKALIYFSGGISSTTFYQDKDFQFLTMNSGDFYGAHLPLFLKSLTDGALVNLRILAFGNNWKFELLAKLRMRLNNALESAVLPANQKKIDESTNINFFRNSFGLEDEYVDELISNSDANQGLKEKLNGPVVPRPDELARELLSLIRYEMQKLGFTQ